AVPRLVNPAARSCCDLLLELEAAYDSPFSHGRSGKVLFLLGCTREKWDRNGTPGCRSVLGGAMLSPRCAPSPPLAPSRKSEWGRTFAEGEGRARSLSTGRGAGTASPGRSSCRGRRCRRSRSTGSGPVCTSAQE